MYHTTSPSKWRAIRRRGLIPRPLPRSVQVKTGIRNGTYLEADKEEAHGWGALLALPNIPEGVDTYIEKYVVLRVKVPGGALLVPDPDVRDIGQETSAFITNVYIPPKSIILVDSGEFEWG